MVSNEPPGEDRPRDTRQADAGRDRVVVDRSGSGATTTALVAGILGTIAGLLSILDVLTVLLGVVAVVLGVIAIVAGGVAFAKIRRVGATPGSAAAAILFGLVAAVLGVLGIIVVGDVQAPEEGVEELETEAEDVGEGVEEGVEDLEEEAENG